MAKVSHSPGSRSLAKRGRKISSAAQPDLFAALAEPSVIGRENAPDLDLGPELMGAVHAALRAAKDSGLSRDRIADRMNLALPDYVAARQEEQKQGITKRQLDAWMAESKEFHELPARFLAAFCWAAGSEEPLRVIARALGFDLVDARESAALALGEAQVEIANLRRKVGLLTKTLGS